VLITGGRLGDIVGRRRMFVIGAAGFTVSSVLCAFAQSSQMLIAFRVLEGAFGAVMVPQGFGLIKEVFPANQLGAAFGAFGPVIGLSAVCGPVLAGALIDADWYGTGWRMIFLINVPFGVLAVAGALRFMPSTRGARDQRLDLPGMLMIITASLLLIFPLVQGRDLGWPAWCFAAMAAPVPVLVVFVLYERRADSPLIVLSVFSKRAFSAGLLVIIGFFGALIGLLLAFGLFVQIGLGFSPLHAGLTFAPWAFGTALGAAASGAVLGPKFGRRVIHAGLLVMAAGLVLVWFVIHNDGPDVTSLALGPGLLVAGVGGGLALAPLFDVILSSVDDHEVGSASGVLNAMQQFGGSIGIALLGTIFFSLLASHDFTDAVQVVLLITAAVALLTFGLAFLLPRHAAPARS
jgi:EmrB/QacA subfamily drug resistance transporter